MRIDFGDLEVALAAGLAAGIEPPHPAVRDRLMARIHVDQPPVPAGFAFNMAAQVEQWLPHPVPGIRVRLLSSNRDYSTLLLDVAPGTRFPPHHHSGAEDCYVIAGSLFTWGRRLGPGDFLHADPGSDHTEMWTVDGCQVLLIVSPEDHAADGV